MIIDVQLCWKLNEEVVEKKIENEDQNEKNEQMQDKVNDVKRWWKMR